MLEILLGPRRTPKYFAPLLFARLYSSAPPDIVQSSVFFEEMPSISFASGCASDNSAYVDSTVTPAPMVSQARADMGRIWFTAVAEEI